MIATETREVISKIVEKITKDYNPKKIILFGSYAKGIQTRHSDIDLLIISEDDTLMNRALKISPLPLHITSITPSEFISMLKSKEFTVGSEVVKKNIVLVGVEDYYRLRAHAA